MLPKLSITRYLSDFLCHLPRTSELSDRPRGGEAASSSPLSMMLGPYRASD